jgi:predicted AAA+ superfamily ATPase
MYIPQLQLGNLLKLLSPQKAVVVYGPRRCGKTTLLREASRQLSESFLFVDGEDISVQGFLSSQSIERLKSFMGDKRVLIIDEAQRIPNIGLNIKLILDNVEGAKVIASGSSSFDLARNIGEPLTGKKFTLKMYPLAQLELNAVESRAQTQALLEHRLVYGSYPEVVIGRDDAREALYLRELVASYLFKDILELEGVRHSDKISRLLQLLAFQIGKEVSFTELGMQLGMSKNTAERYLDLLEKAFVVFRLDGFSRNLRKEIVKNSRYFFYDNGVRNALINNFNPLALRNDAGMLWENYVIVERLKKQEYLQQPANTYFWRTYDRKEIDLVEERSGCLCGYEIKWTKGRMKAPAGWLETYENADYKVINRENYLEFIA